MKLSKFGPKVLWRTVAAVSGIVLALSIGGSAVTTEWSGYINGKLGISSTKIVVDENSTEDPIHFKSAFSKYTDALDNARKVSKQIQAEGSVLLKNEKNALPLNKGAKVTIFGYASADPALGGSGSGAVNAADRKFDVEKACDEGGKLKLNKTLYNYYKGQLAADNQAKNGKLIRTYGGSGFGAGSVPKDYIAPEIDPSNFPADVKASFAEYNDAAIFFFSRIGGEGADIIKTHASEEAVSKKYLVLTDAEKALLTEMKNGNFSKRIVIMNTMNTPEMEWLDEYNIDACLHIGGPGEVGLDAVTDILVGNTNPSGKVADTYATDLFSAPAMMNFGNYDFANGAEIDRALSRFYVSYNEGIYVGYRYYETRYEDTVLKQGNASSTVGAWGSDGNWEYKQEVQYPFGYGLSYTTFEQTLNSVNVNWDEKSAEVTVTVKNTGNKAGKDVVEIYAQAPYTKGGIEKSAVQLVGFVKTGLLDAGKSEKITYTVDLRDLASYDYANYKTYVMEDGDYYFAIGNDVHDALNNILAAKGKTTADGMDNPGVAAKAHKEIKTGFDKDEYAYSTTMKKVVNQFEETDVNYYTKGTAQEVKYLSRSDWSSTWPKSMDDFTAPEQFIKDVNSYYSTTKTPSAYEKGSSDTSSFVSGAEFKYSLVMMKGVDFNDAAWELILNQLSVGDLLELSRQGRPGAKSVNLPATTAIDGPAGYGSGKYIEDYTTLNDAENKKKTTVNCNYYPAEVVVADTWNVALAEEMGKAVGEEGLWGGGVGWYGPAANIHRTPFSGRNFEYYSEDGFISGIMAEGVCHGAKSKGIIIYVKHCVLNDMELHREGLITFANEQSIREIYLKSFQAPCESKGKDDPCATGVMGAFNLLGAKWSGHHEGLWRNVLRGEWGYTGNITTDFGQTPNGYMEPQLAYEAGTTMFCTSGNSFTEYLSDLVEKDAKLYANMREASHYILYNFANSAAMNGLTSNTRVVPVRVWYENLLLSLEIISGIVFGVSAVMVVLREFAKKEEK